MNQFYTTPVKLEEFVPILLSDIEKEEFSFSRQYEQWKAKMQKDIDLLTESEQRLAEIDALARKTGSILYRMIQIPRGDGYAFYQITKVGARNCTVKHIVMGGDDWMALEFGEGGSFPLSFVKRMLNAHSR
jgi:hypothetical protein